MGISTSGLAEMQGKLEHLSSAEVREKLVLRAVRDAGAVIQEAMQEACHVLAAKNPGSDALDPGTLRRDIRITAKVDELDGIARAIVGPKHYAYVARWVEFGHRQIKGGRSYADGKGGWGGKGHEVGEPVPGYPSLRPAIERSEGPALEKFKGSLQTYLPEELK